MTELEQVIRRAAALRPRTKAVYTLAVQSFVSHVGDDNAKWTNKAVVRWRDRLAATGLKPQTVNIYLTGLKYASRRIAERTRDPERDFAQAATQLKADAPKVSRQALTLDEGRALVAACVGPRPLDLRDFALCVLGLRTGMHRASLCSIHIEHIQGMSSVLTTLKGGILHDVPIDPETFGALVPWRSWLRGQGVHTGPLFRSLSKPLVTGHPRVGPSLQPDGLYKALRRRAKRAGVRHFHPHVFRSTYAAWMRDVGATSWEIAQTIGGGNLKMAATAELRERPRLPSVMTA